jgi:hypothetical protein
MRNESGRSEAGFPVALASKRIRTLLKPVVLLSLCLLVTACGNSTLGRNRDGSEISGRRRFTDDTTFVVSVTGDHEPCKQPCRQTFVNVTVANTGTVERYAVCRAKGLDAAGRVLHTGKLIISFPAGPLLAPGETVEQRVPWPTSYRRHMKKPTRYEGTCRAAVWDGEVPI